MTLEQSQSAEPSTRFANSMNAPGYLLEALLIGLTIHEVPDFADVDRLLILSDMYAAGLPKQDLRSSDPNVIIPRPRLNEEARTFLRNDRDVRGILRWLNEIFGKQESVE